MSEIPSTSDFTWSPEVDDRVKWWCSGPLGTVIDVGDNDWTIHYDDDPPNRTWSQDLSVTAAFLLITDAVPPDRLARYLTSLETTTGRPAMP